MLYFLWVLDISYIPFQLYSLLGALKGSLGHTKKWQFLSGPMSQRFKQFQTSVEMQSRLEGHMGRDEAIERPTLQGSSNVRHEKFWVSTLPNLYFLLLA